MADMRKKSVSGSVAYAFFLILYIIAMGAVIAFVLSKVWIFAEEYENARPTNVMDVYIADLNENLWDESIARTISAMPHPFQSDEEVLRLVQEMFSSELTYMRTVGGDGENALVYAILCEDNAFGRAYLVRDPSVEVEFGSRPWRIDHEEFDFSGLYSSQEITVPQSYSVVLNGQTLGTEYITATGIHYDVLEEYYKDFPGLPTKVTYHMDHILGHLEPQIYDDLGQPAVIDTTRNDSQYIRPIDEGTYARLNAFTQNFADPYLRYSSNVVDPISGYAAVEPYLYPNGELSQRLKLTMDGYGWAHTTSYSFEGAQLVNAIALGDGYYSIEINAQTVITYPNKGENGVVRDNNGLRVLVVDYIGEIRAVSIERFQA